MKLKDYDLIDQLWISVSISLTVVVASLCAWAVVVIWSRIFGGGA